MSPKPLLLCTDLDRTLIPNGEAPESPLARPAFRDFVAREHVTLAYVTGRHLALVEEAVSAYALPVADYLITDVGTQIYARKASAWRHWTAWDSAISGDWSGHSAARLAAMLDRLGQLRLQEAEKQNTHKLSYYTPLAFDRAECTREIEQTFAAANVRASLIWSIDEPAGLGLLDILPASATKLHAIRFLRQELGFGLAQTLFAGDSGNDLDVLVSEVPAVLVANAAGDVRAAARALAAENGQENALYLADGTRLPGLNGNYAAGILEGAAHFHPELAPTLTPHI